MVDRKIPTHRKSNKTRMKNQLLYLARVAPEGRFIFSAGTISREGLGKRMGREYDKTKK
jgi:hypothetical protein